ncbi:MAG TPA: hypothetical protein VKQ71_03690 [Acidimicrobiales bacterium]|nr:hypothetical protein [Acidimicrobiales bacterium]
MTTTDPIPKRPELFIRHLPEHVDTTYYQRPIALILLVAELSPDGRPVPLSPADLAELQDRSLRAGRRDHDTLCKLHKHRILRRWRGTGGRVPDAWALNPDMDNWREVPWITSRSDFAAEIRRLCASPSSVIARDGAGHSVEVSPPDPELWGSEGEKPLQVGAESGGSTTDEGEAMTQRPGEMHPSGGGYDRSTLDPSPSVFELKTSSSLGSAQNHDDDESQQHQEAFGRLRSLVFAKTHSPVFGRCRDALEQLAASADVERLVQAAAGAPEFRSPVAFVEFLQEAARAPATPSGRRTCDECHCYLPTNWCSEPGCKEVRRG